jgi:GT2 family glycosyltransferase
VVRVDGLRARAVAVPRHARAAGAARIADIRASVSGVLARHPRVTRVTWHPLRGAPGRVAAGRRWLAGAPARRDPDAHARRYLDDAWYVERHPEAAADAWRHYLDVGVAAGHAPNPVFDVEGYRFDHPDVALHGGDVLRHWVLVGRLAGATPHPLFDPAWYRATHRDIGRIDPFLHYLRQGRREGRRPSDAVDAGIDIALATTAFPVTDGEASEVTVIVPVYGRYMMTARCLYALATRTPVSLGARVVVADDDPTRPMRPLLAAIEGLVVHANPRNLGFLRSCAAAVATTQGPWVVLLNNDTVVRAGWLEALLAAGAPSDVAMVGGRLIGPDGRLQEAGVIMERDAYGTPYGRGDDPQRPWYRFVRDVDCVSGACLLIRRAAWDAVGGFDDDFAPAYFEEYDLAFALRAAGWRVRYQPAAVIGHLGSASHGITERDRATARHRAFFRLKWRTTLARQYPRPAPAFLARERPHAGGVVLVADDAVPEHDRHAGGLWMWQWLRLLHDADLKVVFLPRDGVDRQPYADDLRQAGIEVLAPGVDLDAWLDANGRYLDAVLLARPLVADRMLPAVRRWTRARVVYFTHDLHWLREQRRSEVTGDERARRDSAYLREIERRLFRSVDVVLTPGEHEVRHIRDDAPAADVRVLPPFAATGGSPGGAGPALVDRDVVLFVGGFAHLPNVDAATHLVRDVMPLVWREVPEARVRIVGDAPPPEVRALAGAQVAVTGWVPDLDTELGQARLTLSPLRFGSGVKGKVVTSLAAGVPVVTTPIGDEGLGLMDGTEALIGEGPDDLARAVVRLFREAGLAERLADGGRAYVDARLSADRTRSVLLDALR